MSRTTRHFLDLLDVELEDICADLRETEEMMRTRIAISEITEYVFQENTAFLEFEIACVSRLRTAVKNHGFDPLAPIDITTEEVMRLCTSETKRMQMPQSVCLLVGRRIRKLILFLSEGQTVD